MSNAIRDFWNAARGRPLLPVGGEAPPLQTKRSAQLTLRAATTAVRTAFAVEVQGDPPPGPCVFASNHPTLLEGPLGLALDVNHVRAIAKPYRTRVVNSVVGLADPIVSGQGEGTLAAVEHLRAGGSIWLAYAGGCTRGSLPRGRTGPARIARDADVPLVPLAIHGTEELKLTDFRPWRRPRVTLELGTPIEVEAGDDLQARANQVGEQLAEMLDKPFDPDRAPVRYDAQGRVLSARPDER
jgi:1-acyl-sn-glycerol-3-phosphate acyltransferase